LKAIRELTETEERSARVMPPSHFDYKQEKKKYKSFRKYVEAVGLNPNEK
jgi:hypothetical protein